MSDPGGPRPTQPLPKWSGPPPQWGGPPPQPERSNPGLIALITILVLGLVGGGIGFALTRTHGSATVQRSLASTPGPTTVKANFNFTSGSTFGSYSMKGELVGGRLTLRPDQWITQPDGFEMVDLSAEVSDPSATTISGTIDNPNCTTFSVSR